MLIDDSKVQILAAAWVAPISAQVVKDGAVAIRGGRILAVGGRKLIERQFEKATISEYRDAIILPALVNAHTHLELTNVPRPASSGHLAAWLLNVMRSAPGPGREGDERAKAAVEAGIQQCQKYGVGTVGDITTRCEVTRAALGAGRLRAVSFGEVRAMAQRRGKLNERIKAASDRASETDRVRVGLSPHAPYSVEIEGYRQCVEVAKELGLPLTTHLAETAEEAEFLAMGSGPFRELWEQIGGWDDQVPRFAGSSVRLANEIGLLDSERSLLAHVNFCDDDDLAILAAGKASVVYCPRTHSYFGHPPHRWRDMLASGINVAVGTDSAASSGDLNLMDDLRLLRRISPATPADTIWRMGTISAARALGLGGECGTLEAGKAADVVIFPTAGEDPLENLLNHNERPAAVWLAGAEARD